MRFTTIKKMTSMPSICYIAVVRNNGLIVKRIYRKGEITHLKSNPTRDFPPTVCLFHMYQVEITMNETLRAQGGKGPF